MQSPVSIRINPCKFMTNKTEEAVPWCETGSYLSERPSFTFDPLFHAGTYYVQEASSMFLEQAVRTIITESAEASGFTCGELSSTNEQKPVTALDLCAAPGGKSTLLQTLLPVDSLLVCNEVIRSRSMILAENMAKWGMPGNIITNNDPKDFGCLTHIFDIILADLPCSGEGMFRKDHVSRDEWSVDNVKLCASRQRRIIHDVWNTLKPGGWLIYSTCTFNTEENEENVYTLAGELGAEIVSIPIKKEWNIAGAVGHNIPAYRFFPHRTCGEGFFLALMRKNSKPAETIIAKAGNNKSKQLPGIPEQIRRMLLNPEKFAFHPESKKIISENIHQARPQAKHTQDTTVINAMPEIHSDIFNLLRKHLKIISAGIFLGELKGKDFIPATQLAMSTELRREAFHSVDLPLEQAITYLQREVLVMPEETPTGYILITYKNTPLGFVKNIGSRANNLYPQEWRIRKKLKVKS